MKKLILLTLIISNIAFAQMTPMSGAYKYCYTETDLEKEAFLNIVKFENGLGIQMYSDGFPISMIIKLDGKKHTTTERISEYKFEYLAAYKNNILKLVFTNERDARMLGFNQEHIFKFNGLLATFTFNGEKISCRMRLPCERYPCESKD